MIRRSAKPPAILSLDKLNDLEQPGTPRHANGFERGGDSKADGLFRPARIGDHEVGIQRIQSTLHALNGSVEAFQINANVSRHGITPRTSDQNGI